MKPAEATFTAKPPPYFGPHDDVVRNRLVTGAVIDRHTDGLGRRRDDPRPAFVDVPTPCCARPIRRVETSSSPVAAWCCSCALTFELELIDENDGGYMGRFTVEEWRPVVVASHRRPRPRKSAANSS